MEKRVWPPSFSRSHTERWLAPPYSQRLGKWICDPHKLRETRSCLVYSLGSNGHYDFEDGILDVRPDCEIHTFDPTSEPPSPEVAKKIHFHEFGIGAKDGTISLGKRCGSNCPVKSLHNIVRDLQHEQRIIDVFKVWSV